MNDNFKRLADFAHSCSVETNLHHLNNETQAEYVDRMDIKLAGEPCECETLYELQVYPSTMTGFHTWAGYDFDGLVSAALTQYGLDGPEQQTVGNAAHIKARQNDDGSHTLTQALAAAKEASEQ